MTAAILTESENDLSTSVDKDLAGLNQHEKELLIQVQAAEDRNQLKLDRIERITARLCFEQFPWLQCASVEFCKEQLPVDVVLIRIIDTNGKQPTPQTATAIEAGIARSGASPWPFIVEHEA